MTCIKVTVKTGRENSEEKIHLFNPIKYVLHSKKSMHSKINRKALFVLVV